MGIFSNIEKLKVAFQGTAEPVKDQSTVDSSPPSANPQSEEVSLPSSTCRQPAAPGVAEYYAPFTGDPHSINYKPAIIREAEIHFFSSKYGIDGSRILRFTNAIRSEGIDWDHDAGCALPISSLEHKPRFGTTLDELPDFATTADNYKQVEKDFIDYIYRNERVGIFYCPLFKSYSQLGESDGTFRGRLTTQAREVRDDALEKLRNKYEAKLKNKERQLNSADPWNYEIEEDLADLEAELAEEMQELPFINGAPDFKLQNVSIKPGKEDIDVRTVALVWLPYDRAGQKAW